VPDLLVALMHVRVAQTSRHSGALGFRTWLSPPAIARGPFVMDTEAEIEQAYADYRAGRFGPI
jgi:redox-sensitive bicupin YhaK (pirin superfamily)